MPTGPLPGGPNRPRPCGNCACRFHASSTGGPACFVPSSPQLGSRLLIPGSDATDQRCEVLVLLIEFCHWYEAPFGSDPLDETHASLPIPGPASHRPAYPQQPTEESPCPCPIGPSFVIT